MTDEEYGRAWSAFMKIAPNTSIIRRYADPANDRQEWWFSDLPRCLVTAGHGMLMQLTEAEAYAALGRAVRAVHRDVPPLKETDHAKS